MPWGRIAPASTVCSRRTCPSGSCGAAVTATSWARAWWSWPAASSRRLQEVAGPLLQALADELTATAALTVRDGEDAAVVLDVRSPRHADMHIGYRAGLRHPVSIAASGIAILAGGPPRPSERAEVTEARRRGWARSTGELLPGASGVAAPTDGGRRGERGVDRRARRCGDGPRRDGDRARAGRRPLSVGVGVGVGVAPPPPHAVVVVVVGVFEPRAGPLRYVARKPPAGGGNRATTRAHVGDGSKTPTGPPRTGGSGGG